MTDSECPPDVLGTWSGCAYASTCEETGPPKMRTVLDYSCMAGRCTSENRIETMACTRSTAGEPCGEVRDGPWSACCSGSRSLVRVTPTCSAGACGDVDSTVVDDACGPRTEVCNYVDDTCDGTCDEGCFAGMGRYLSTPRGHHLFTRDPAEAAPLGYDRLEAPIAFRVTDTPGPGAVELHRCRVPGTDFRLYTVSGVVPCDGIPGATVEAVLGYIQTTATCGSTPLHRLTNMGRWFLTIAAAEVSSAVASGWEDRGILGYAW